jgi:hypothetical protein
VDTDPYPGKPKWPAGKEIENFMFERAGGLIPCTFVLQKNSTFLIYSNKYVKFWLWKPE